MSDINLESHEKLYGKLIKEDEGFYYFEGIGRYGVTVPKHVHWNFQENEKAEE